MELNGSIDRGKPYIVCGMGLVGYRVVGLLARLGMKVTVITTTVREEWLREPSMAGVVIIRGNARDQHLLVEAGIAEAAGLLAVTDNDLVNVEVALDAKRLRPDIPVVIRLFDQVLAQELEKTLDIRRALAVSVLAAPSFAAAIIGEDVAGSFGVDGELFVVGRERIEAGSRIAGATLQEISSRYRVAHIARLRKGERAAIDPRPEEVAEEGDQLMLIGCAFDWDEVTRTPRTTRTRLKKKYEWLTVALNHLRPGVWGELLRDVWRNAPMALRSLLVMFSLFLAGSVFVCRAVMGLSFVDAVYFVTTSATTVGYGDITAHTWGARLYVCLVMLIGATTIALAYSMLTDYLVTSRFEQMIGIQQIPQENHVIVVGLGNLGYRIVDELRRTETDVVAVEKSSSGEFVDVIRPHLPVVIGDARAQDVLVAAGVGKANAVIAATDNDAVNLGVGLTAKRLNPAVRTVVRLFDADLASKVRSSFRFDAAISPPAIGAPTFVASLLMPDVKTAFVLDDELLVILARAAGEWSELSGDGLREEGIHLLMRRRAKGQAYLPLGNDERLEAGDHLLAMVKIPLASGEPSG